MSVSQTIYTFTILILVTIKKLEKLIICCTLFQWLPFTSSGDFCIWCCCQNTFQPGWCHFRQAVFCGVMKLNTTMLNLMCLVIMASGIKWHVIYVWLHATQATKNTSMTFRLIFGSPCLPSVPHSVGLCPAVSQRASIFQYILWLTNCFVMYCGFYYTHSFVMYTNCTTLIP